jgi:hypothetical protein
MSNESDTNITPGLSPKDDSDVAPGQPPTSGTGIGWTASDWLGELIIASDGEKIGKLQDIYVDVETDVPQFGTVKEGFLDRHLTFVPLVGVSVTPGELHVTVLKDQVRSAPDINLRGDELSQDDESALYHHFEMNYTPIENESGRRLARR